MISKADVPLTEARLQQRERVKKAVMKRPACVMKKPCSTSIASARKEMKRTPFTLKRARIVKRPASHNSVLPVQS